METASREDERARRLRNNKRRHRARQKEYTADLEQRLRELEQKGVQASIEIQLSARKVAQENKRLRILLRHVGVGEETISSWVDETEQNDGKSFGCSPNQPCSRKSGCGHAGAKDEPTRSEELDGDGAMRKSSAEHASISSPVKADPTSCTSSNPDDKVDIAMKSSTLENAVWVDHAGPSSCPAPETSQCLNRQRQCSIGDEFKFSDTSIPATVPPCKLLTRLKDNPWADISQVDIFNDEEPKPEIAEDGIPCSRAHQLLMHYATTESKLDAVAHVLEEGCVPNAGAGGGCKVKSKTILQALDDICL